MAAIEIKGFLQTSFIDWPGKVASVVFLPGCNYRCPYCHNHLLVTDPQKLISFEMHQVLQQMETLRGWVDGVCVTGGEPTMNGGLVYLLEQFKKNNWEVKLDTNGSRPQVLENLIERELVSAFSVDVKAPLEPIPYRRNAGNGSDPELVRESLEIIAESGLPVELRTTVHPHLLSLSEVVRMAEQTLEIFGPGRNHKLQQCRVDDVLDPELKRHEPLDRETLDQWSGEVRTLEALNAVGVRARA